MVMHSHVHAVQALQSWPFLKRSYKAVHEKQRRATLLTARISSHEAEQVGAAEAARLPNMLDGPDLHLMRWAATDALPFGLDACRPPPVWTMALYAAEWHWHDMVCSSNPPNHMCCAAATQTWARLAACCSGTALLLLQQTRRP